MSHQRFGTLDRDHDGYVSSSERPLALRPEQFQRADRNRDGRLDFAEYLDAAASQRRVRIQAARAGRQAEVEADATAAPTAAPPGATPVAPTAGHSGALPPGLVFILGLISGLVVSRLWERRPRRASEPQSALVAGNPQQAVVLLEQQLACEMRPAQRAQLQSMLALALARSGQLQAAVKLIPVLDPERVTADELYQLGTNLESEYPAEARRVYEIVYARDVNFPGVRERLQSTVPANTAGYRIQEMLGSGGTGKVYRAASPDGRAVALKLLSPAARSALDRVRFGREAAALAALRHPGIVQLVDIGTAGDVPYLAMELLEGKTLARTPPDERPAARCVIEQILGALSCVHMAGFLHRDLKPSNVFVCQDGRVVLIDFGLACEQNATKLTRTGEVAGTVRYMSPEMAEFGTQTVRSDLFATALIAVELLYGLNVHGDGEQDEAHIVSSLRSGTYYEVAARVLKLHGKAGQILLRSLLPDPEGRPESAAALAKELAAAWDAPGLPPETLATVSRGDREELRS
jgi:predicted Ser/Thr protein kinase